MVDFRRDHLQINNERVKQLCVIGVAVERYDALHLAQNQKERAKEVKDLKGARCSF